VKSSVMVPASCSAPLTTEYESLLKVPVNAVPSRV
jgi:hypothetical protein